MTQQLRTHAPILALLGSLAGCTSAPNKKGSPDSPTSTVDSAVTVGDSGRDSAVADSTHQADSVSDTGRDSAGDTGTVVTPGPWIALSCGDGDCCAIARDLKLACWGADDEGQLEDMPGGTFTQVNVSYPGSCALDGAGSITCWPSESDYPIPAGIFAEVRAVARGYGCALDSGGVLECWQGPQGDGYTPAPNGVPFAHLAGGRGVQGALTADGTPTCWGQEEYFTRASGWRTLTPTASGFTAMVCGTDHCCVLDADGYATCWGGDYTLTVEPAHGQFSSLSAGDNSTCGVVLDGSEADCWGYGVGGSIPAPAGDRWLNYEVAQACGLTVSGNILCLDGAIGDPPDPP